MFIRLRLPKTLLWVFDLMIIFLVMFTLFRLVTFVAFKPDGLQLKDHMGSFLLGLRFDLRWICFILSPIVAASLFPKFSPFYSYRTKLFWTWYLAFASFFVIFFFAADFGCFSYNKTRLNASALNFVEDPVISATMLWQAYPMFWMLAGLVISVLLLRKMFRQLHGFVVYKTDGKRIMYQRKWFVLTAFLFVALCYGRIDTQPLKWNAAFRYNDSFKSYLALNPLQNFFSTLKFREPQYDVLKARDYFTEVKQWIGWPSSAVHYTRNIQPHVAKTVSQPNVVLVLCESFSMYKSSMSGNQLNTTPYFKSLSDSGLFFNHCFTPHFSTARGLFALLTGIPDVQLSKFSSRNPEALDQHTIINDFKGYEKFYFLGGSASFNNFEGLVKNVEGIQMITEGQFASKPLNVWGISDHDLFREAHSVFSRQTRPFFALVQTADNHRPFTIPESDSSFKWHEASKQELRKNGFESVEEYNSFRYFDHCIQQFMEEAKKAAYFDNTIFVFVGDHGVSGNATAVYPSIWTSERLTEEHVPLLFYAPGKIQAERRSYVVSQVDVLPSIAGLANIPYTNSTIGRDVVTKDNGEHFAFTIAHDEGRLGLITDQFYFTKNLNFEKETLEFFPWSRSFTTQQKDSIRNKVSSVTTGLYETSRYMLLHNKKSIISGRKN
jgi:phosphoglycerol transferase MdoB-like AlkP superfamily enzyme